MQMIYCYILIKINKNKLLIVWEEEQYFQVYQNDGVGSQEGLSSTLKFKNAKQD